MKPFMSTQQLITALVMVLLAIIGAGTVIYHIVKYLLG